MYKSEFNPAFKTALAETIFHQKYKHDNATTWSELSKTLVEDVCRDKLSNDEKDQLAKYHAEMKVVFGGRYLYYVGRAKKFFNNCFCLKALEDTREDWGDLSKRSELCLTTGGGIGVDYSVYRRSGSKLKSTGGVASGPLSKARMINEIGREVIQGGSRRAAIYGSLNWQHGDIDNWLVAKDWHTMPAGNTGLTLWDLKQQDFNFPTPLDMTNISVDYDTAWLLNYWKTGDVGEVFLRNVEQCLKTGDPGLSFNFFDKENETLRNA